MTFITTHTIPLVVPPVAGGIANLSVTAPLDYQWQKDGVDLADSALISGATTPHLIIAATLQDVGEYRVVVSNPAGSVMSDPAVIAVRPSCPGDIDQNGTIDTTDLSILLGAFGTMCP